MKILAFAGSSSVHSINKKFVTNVSRYYKDDEVQVVDLSDYEMPLYSIDRQNEGGIPRLAYQFAEKIDWADLIIISFAEHNGNYAAAYKNLIDWVSRIQGRKPFQDSCVFLLATSNGARGGQSVLEIAAKRMPFDGAEVLESFSLPQFSTNFEEGKGIITPLYRSQLEAKIRKTKREMTKKLDVSSNKEEK